MWPGRPHAGYRGVRVVPGVPGRSGRTRSFRRTRRFGRTGSILRPGTPDPAFHVTRHGKERAGGAGSLSARGRAGAPGRRGGRPAPGHSPPRLVARRFEPGDLGVSPVEGTAQFRAVFLCAFEVARCCVECGVGVARLRAGRGLRLARRPPLGRQVAIRFGVALGLGGGVRVRCVVRGRRRRSGGTTPLPGTPRAGDGDGWCVAAGPGVRHGVRIRERPVEVDRVEPGALERADEEPGAHGGTGVRIRHRRLDGRPHLVEHGPGHRVAGVRGEVGTGLRERVDHTRPLTSELPDHGRVGVRLGLADRGPEVDRVVEGALVRQQVDDPRGGCGLPESADGRGEGTVVLADRALTNRALGDEVRGRDEEQFPRHVREPHAAQLARYQSWTVPSARRLNGRYACSYGYLPASSTSSETPRPGSSPGCR